MCICISISSTTAIVPGRAGQDKDSYVLFADTAGCYSRCPTARAPTAYPCLLPEADRWAAAGRASCMQMEQGTKVQTPRHLLPALLALLLLPPSPAAVQTAAHRSRLLSQVGRLISCILSSAAMFLLVQRAPRARGRSRQSAVLWLALPQLCREGTRGSQCAGRREQVRQGLCTYDRCGMIQSGAICCWEGRGVADVLRSILPSDGCHWEGVLRCMDNWCCCCQAVMRRVATASIHRLQKLNDTAAFSCCRLPQQGMAWHHVQLKHLPLYAAHTCCCSCLHTHCTRMKCGNTLLSKPVVW